MEENRNVNIKLYSTDDVCKLLRIGRQKCLELFHRSDFPSIRIGRKFWVKEDCLEEYLSERRVFKEKW